MRSRTATTSLPAAGAAGHVFLTIPDASHGHISLCQEIVSKQLKQVFQLPLYKQLELRYKTVWTLLKLSLVTEIFTLLYDPLSAK